MRGNGFLAIWSDVPAEQETDYLHWLTREHAAERVGTPGFIAVRAFRAMTGDVRRYFILYELDRADVVSSPAYLARLDAPTPWTRRIMPILGNFVRGGGSRLAGAGNGQGSYVLPVRLRTPLPPAPDQLAGELAAGDRVMAVRLLVTDDGRTSIPTSEKSIRARDESFAALLLMEALDATALRAAATRLSGSPFACTDLAADTAYAFAQVFGLSREMLAGG